MLSAVKASVFTSWLLRLSRYSAYLVSAFALAACASPHVNRDSKGFNELVSPYVENHPYLDSERFELTQLNGNVRTVRYFRGCNPVCTGYDEKLMYELDRNGRLVWAGDRQPNSAYETWSYKGDSIYPSSHTRVTFLADERNEDTWHIQRDEYGNQLNLPGKPRDLYRMRAHNTSGDVELDGYQETWYRVDKATWLYGTPDPNAHTGSRIDRFYIDGLLVKRLESKAPVTEIPSGRILNIDVRESYAYEHYPNGNLKMVSTFYEVGNGLLMVKHFAKGMPALRTELRYSQDGLLQERRNIGFAATVFDFRAIAAMLHYSSYSNGSGIGSIRYTDYEFDDENNWIGRTLICSDGAKQWRCNREERMITYW